RADGGDGPQVVAELDAVPEGLLEVAAEGREVVEVLEGKDHRSRPAAARPVLEEELLARDLPKVELLEHAQEEKGTVLGGGEGDEAGLARHAHHAAGRAGRRLAHHRLPAPARRARVARDP